MQIPNYFYLFYFCKSISICDKCELKIIRIYFCDMSIQFTKLTFWTKEILNSYLRIDKIFQNCFLNLHGNNMQYNDTANSY